MLLNDKILLPCFSLPFFLSAKFQTSAVSFFEKSPELIKDPKEQNNKIVKRGNFVAGIKIITYLTPEKTFRESEALKTRNFQTHRQPVSVSKNYHFKNSVPKKSLDMALILFLFSIFIASELISSEINPNLTFIET